MMLPRDLRTTILSRLRIWDDNDDLSEEVLLNRISQLVNEANDFEFVYLRDRFFPARKHREAIIDLSIGFIYVGDGFGQDVPEVEGFTFGISMLIKSSEYGRDSQYNRDFSRGLPVIIQFVNYESHNSFQPPGGTCACWVQNRIRGTGTIRGVLTCEHVIGPYNTGDSFTLYDLRGNLITGTIGSLGRPCIDAAVIDIPKQNHPPGLTQLGLIPNIIPGMAVQLNLPSGTQQGSILRVSADPYYFGTAMGHRTIIDCCGVSGDSGSLALSQGNGVGMYMGEIKYNSGNTEGMCQNLEQVSNYFNVDFYH